jgi:hypothetical protein|tara:strand:- start:1408 stop:1821 length:414 start_codon:yes stop_codon:yes gene_type:complete
MELKMIDAKRDFDRSLEELLAGGIVKSGEKIIDPCFYCGESTAFGYGKFINRVGYIDNDFNGWACAECAGYECRVCEEQIYLDEDLRWSDDLSHCHEECLSEEQNQIITMFFELGGDWELPYDDAEAWFTDVIKAVS